MRWKTKAVLQRVLSSVPFGSEVNYLLQRARADARIDESSFVFRAKVALAQLDAASVALDARETGIDDGSFDLITSNSTLEHVPREDLDALLGECQRLLKPGGLMAFRIDYEDHYAIGDVALSPYNFLQYSEQNWRRY